MGYCDQDSDCANCLGGNGCTAGSRCDLPTNRCLAEVASPAPSTPAQGSMSGSASGGSLIAPPPSMPATPMSGGTGGSTGAVDTGGGGGTVGVAGQGASGAAAGSGGTPEAQTQGGNAGLAGQPATAGGAGSEEKCGPWPACTSGFTCTPSGCSGWANWVMPNPATAGLPHPAVYTRPVPGVVIDELTGLWWQRDLDTNDSSGTNCFPSCSFDTAVLYCKQLSVAGRTDWRLPTRIELVSLVDFTIATPGPTIDGAAFPGTPGAVFWTASPNASASSFFWLVDFGTGGTYPDGAVTNSFRVRCVR